MDINAQTAIRTKERAREREGEKKRGGRTYEYST
jgi:hypothetical protein